MDTRRLPRDDPGAIAVAAELIRDGGVVAYPTDTLYGLGAHAFRPEAVAKVFAAKGRAADHPLPLLLARTEDLLRVAAAVPIAAWRLAAVFWPGALTLVLTKSPHVPPIVTAGGETVAVRVPDHRSALALIAAVSAPITGTSANRSGAPPPRTPDDVLAQLGGRIDAVLDGGPCPGGVESTVVDVSAAKIRLLRQGAIERGAIEDVVETTLEV